LSVLVVRAEEISRKQYVAPAIARLFSSPNSDAKPDGLVDEMDTNTYTAFSTNFQYQSII